MTELAVKIPLPPVTQMGVVVRDIKQAVDFYSQIFGLGPFSPIIDFSPERNWYMGEISPLHLRVTRAMWGAMEFELIQPVEGKSVHKDFLDSGGEGLHHLGIEARNYDEIVEKMQQHGFTTLQQIEVYRKEFDCWARASFFDTRKVGNIILEVMHRPWMAKK